MTPLLRLGYGESTSELLAFNDVEPLAAYGDGDRDRLLLYDAG